MLNQRCHYSYSSTAAAKTVSALFQVGVLGKGLFKRHSSKTMLFIGTCVSYIYRLDSNISDMDAIHLAAGMVFLNGFGVLTINQLFMNGYHNGMKVRVAICGLMYRKVGVTSCVPPNVPYFLL